MIIYKKSDGSHLKIEGAVYRKPPRKNFLRTIFKKQNTIHKIPTLSKERAKKYWYKKYGELKKNEIREIKYKGPIVSIEAARAMGLNKYFTGKPCINGHIDQRYTKFCICLTCQNEKSKKRFAKKRREAGIIPLVERVTPRKTAIMEGKYKFWSETPCSKGHIGWRATKTCICLECRKIARRVPEDKKVKRMTKDEAKAKRKEYQVAKESRRRAKMNGRHTVAQIRQMFKDQDYRCKSCGDCIKEYYERDHIMPIALGGSDNIENIQLLCRSCNNRKGAMHPDEWNALI